MDKARPATLQDRFDPRRNSFDLLRLLLAGCVVLTHGPAIHTGLIIGWRGTIIGDIGVDGFFVVSGFLVARSYLSLRSFPRFAWHRFLRIMPGFWVCLLVIALVVAPLAAMLRGMSPAVAFTGEPSAVGFVLRNLGLFMLQWDIGGIMVGTHIPDSFNGSLWTLAFEALCYLIVGLLGVTGVLARRPALVALGTAALIAVSVLREVGGPGLVNERIQHLVLMFLLGSLAWLYADRIPMRWPLAVLGVALFVAGAVLFDDYRVIGAVGFAYVMFWFATCFRWTWSARNDLSYGLYIYHWPVFQLLVLTGLAALPTPLFVLAGFVVTLLPAWLSWRLVERPAMQHKRSPLPDRVAAWISRVLLRRAPAAGPAAPGQPVPMPAGPAQAGPAQASRGQAVPEQADPERTVRLRAIPEQTVPLQTVPARTVPDQRAADRGATSPSDQAVAPR